MALLLNDLSSSTRHKAVVISDLHFPRPDSHPKYLYEFLMHNPSDSIIILGDFFEGYDVRLGEFGEWHKRCLDLMHQRKTEDGTNIIVIPGNHDKYLRDDRIINHAVFGKNYYTNMVLDEQNGRRTYLTHGDEYDKKTVRENDMMAYQLGETIRVARISLSQVFNYYVGSGNKRLKPSFEKRSCADLARHIREGIVASAMQHDCQAVLCGHTHDPQPFMAVTKNKWLKYGNTGSFTGKLATAMVLTHDDQWKIVNWREKRVQLGLDKLPHRDNINPAAQYREMTESELVFHRTLHAAWMAKAMVTRADESIQRIKAMSESIAETSTELEKEVTRLLSACRDKARFPTNKIRL